MDITHVICAGHKNVDVDLSLLIVLAVDSSILARVVVLLIGLCM
jgi:hypothetical protein